MIENIYDKLGYLAHHYEDGKYADKFVRSILTNTEVKILLNETWRYYRFKELKWYQFRLKRIRHNNLVQLSTWLTELHLGLIKPMLPF